MKTAFNRQELIETCRLLGGEYDFARLVDPVSREVLWHSEGTPAGSCSDQIWKNEALSKRLFANAEKHEGRSYGLERIGAQTFLIKTRTLSMGGHSLALQTADEVTIDIAESPLFARVDKQLRDYKSAADHDSMTEIYSRHYIDETIVPTVERCRETGIEVCACMIDVDRFKSINDNYGHLAGDAVLRDVATFWKERFSAEGPQVTSAVARWGGDEIVVTTTGRALEDVRADILSNYRQMRRVCYYGGLQVPFSMSFGFASSRELTGSWTWDDLLALSDSRMYESKSGSGRAAAKAS